MDLNVSAPVRIFALVGGLAAVAAGVWFFMLGGLSPATSSEPVDEIQPLAARRKAPAARVPSGARSAAAVPTKPKTAVATKPKTAVATKPRQAARSQAGGAAATKPRPVAKARPAGRPPKRAAPRIPNPAGLPPVVAQALARHAVVVVALYSPEAKVDKISLPEARAGARRARVGFVALNVLDRRAAEPLTRKLGVLSAPAFFLYRRPGELVMRVDGFADRDLVAQAALGARSGR